MSEFCGDIVESYRQDECVLKTWTATIGVIVVGCYILALGLMSNPYYVHIVITIGVTIIGALGLNFITGYGGMISLGHGAFVGVGAYALALLTAKAGIPFILAVPMSALISAGVGMFFGLPSLRIKGLYLVMATLAAQVIINFLMVHLSDLTGGVKGFGVQEASIGGFAFDTDRKYFVLTYAMTVVGILAATNIGRSRFGRALVAIRDRDVAAELIGLSLFKYKTLAFCLGSFYAGLAGALWAPYLNVISPEHFPLDLSINYLAIILVGGLGSIMGTIYGAVFIVVVPEVLKIVLEVYVAGLVPEAIQTVPHLKNIAFGLIIIGFLILEPRGLAEVHRRVKKYFKLWPMPY